MPHVGVVMARSLPERSWKDALVNLLARSATAALDKRQAAHDISGDISDAATAFSSWDNCFRAAFCKWPVIALIAIAGLIVLSIVWCIVRCCCCGVSCCCECCYCLKCCGECCGLCDPPRGKRSKYLDEPFVPPNHDQAYRSQAPMHSGLDSVKPSVPQFAEFDAGNKKDADALPAMPSWEDASSTKVLIVEESVEMEPLKRPEPVRNPSLMNVANRSRATSPSAMSPGNVSPYGPPVGHGYMAAGRNNPYGFNQQGYNEYDNHGYGQQHSPGNLNSTAIAAPAGPIHRGTPHQEYNTGYDHGDIDQGYSQFPQSRSPRPYNDEYGRSGTPTSYNNGGHYQGMPSNDGYATARSSPAPQAGYGYGNPIRMGTPGAQAGYGHGNTPRGSPGPQAGYGYPPQRSHTQDERTQPYTAAASHQEYSNDPHDVFTHPAPELYSPLASPIRNNSGFDFSSGYSRSDGGRRSPAPSASGGATYPGYRSYKPADTQHQQQQQQHHNWDGL